MTKVLKKKCVMCGNTFTATKSHAKTCSVKCRKALASQRNSGIKVGRKYIHEAVKFAKMGGLNKIRMETVRNMSSVLFKTPGSVPDSFETNKYKFIKDDTDSFAIYYKFAELRRRPTRHRVRSTDIRK